MGRDKKITSDDGTIKVHTAIRPHLKKWVLLEFYDHSYGPKKYLRGSTLCRAVGRIYRIDDKHVYLQTWQVIGDAEDDNIEGFQIMKKKYKMYI